MSEADRVLGPNHHDNLFIKRKYVVSIIFNEKTGVRAGDVKKHIQTLEGMWRKTRRIFGDKNPHTLEALADLESARKGWEDRHSNWQNW